MKVVLIQDIAKIGQKGSVVNVAEGYAANFLFPKKKAIKATERTLAEVEDTKKHREQEKNFYAKKLKSLGVKLKNISLELIRSANDQGHLYAQVTISDIVSAVQEKEGFDIPEELFLPVSIKELGEHVVVVKPFEGGKEILLNIVVNPK